MTLQRRAAAGSHVVLACLVAGLALGGCQAAAPVQSGAAGTPAAVELGDFVSDGCSRFPDGEYFSCCFLHDVAYWAGGTAEERKAADLALRDCVVTMTDNSVLAAMMYRGVRMGGRPGRDTGYRWGFGWPWPYRKDYAPLTDQEREQVARKTEALCRSLTLNPVTQGYVVRDQGEISAAQAKQVCPNL